MNLKFVLVGLAIALIGFDLYSNVLTVKHAPKEYSYELSAPQQPAEQALAEHQFEYDIFGKVREEQEQTPVVQGPSETLLGKYKVVLKAISLEEQQLIALIDVQNLEEPLTQVGSLKKINQGQKIAGFDVSTITLNKVVFTQGEQQAEIKIFDGENNG